MAKINRTGLLPENNLSELSSKPTALANLGHKTIFVNTKATGGTGTANDPWTGWDTAITWAAHTEYRFPAGVYQYATSPNFALEGIRLIGEAGAKLKYTGTGYCVDFSSQSLAAALLTGVVVEGLEIYSTGSGTVGLYLLGVHYSHFRNIKIHDVTDKGVWTRFAICNQFDTIVLREGDCTDPNNPLMPLIGIQLDSDTDYEGSHPGVNAQTTASVFNNLSIEGMKTASSIGLYLASCTTSTFNGGTSEMLDGWGVKIGPRSFGNVFNNVDIEACGVGSIWIDGSKSNAFNSVLCGVGTAEQRQVKFTDNGSNYAIGNSFKSCQIGNVHLSAGAESNAFISNIVNGAYSYPSATSVAARDNLIVGEGTGANRIFQPTFYTAADGTPQAICDGLGSYGYLKLYSSQSGTDDSVLGIASPTGTNTHWDSAYLDAAIVFPASHQLLLGARGASTRAAIRSDRIQLHTHPAASKPAAGTLGSLIATDDGNVWLDQGTGWLQVNGGGGGGSYLPLTGGTLTGALTVTQPSADADTLKLKASNGVAMLTVATAANYTLVYTDYGNKGFWFMQNIGVSNNTAFFNVASGGSLLFNNGVVTLSGGNGQAVAAFGDAGISCSKAFRRAVHTVANADYACDTNTTDVVIATITDSGHTVTLPATPGDGRQMTLINAAGSSQTLTIAAAGSDSLSGSTTLAAGHSASYVYNLADTKWYQVGSY